MLLYLSLLSNREEPIDCLLNRIDAKIELGQESL